MSSLHYSELCRLCLVNERVSIPIFDGESGIQSLCLKIGTCLPIKVSPEDILPKNICNDCFYKVENQYQFWISTANAEKQLLQWFSNAAPIPETDKGLAAMAAEQTNFKTEMDLDPSAELSKSLSQVEAVLAGETTNVPEKEDDEEEDESEEEGSNSDDSDYDGENAEGDGAKDDGDTDEAYDEELEPTTFVNVSFECDEAGPSGTQQQKQQRAPSAPSTSTSAPAPSGTELILREENSLKSLSNILATPEKQTLVDASSSNTSLKGIKKIFSCPVCKETFGDVKVLARHKLTHPNARTVAFNYIHKSFECDVCQKVFAEKGILNAHKVSHSSERHFVCSVCNKAYKRKVDVKRHMMTHTGQKDHVCNICNYATLDSTTLQNHKKRVHSSTCEYTCDRCGKRFSTLSDLNSHKRIHKEKKFKCLNCEKGFHVQRDLVSHMETHDPSCVNQCDVCLKLFTTKQTLCRHLQKHL